MNVFKVFVLLMVGLMMTLSQAVSAAEVDLMGLLGKLPAALPFLVAKVESDSCRKNLLIFKEDMDGVSSVSKDYIPHVQKSICKVPIECMSEVVGALKKMVQSGGIFEKVAKTFLESKGLDIDTVELLIIGYLENMCSKEAKPAVGEEAKPLEEL